MTILKYRKSKYLITSRQKQSGTVVTFQQKEKQKNILKGCNNEKPISDRKRIRQRGI